MKDIERRSTFTLSLAAMALVPGAVAAQQRAPTEGREIRPGIRQVDLGERQSRIQGYNKVRMRDIVFQPGADLPDSEMANAMVCHITEGELTVRQDGRDFVARKDTVWDCGVGTREGAKNNGNTAAVMRVTDLLTS